MKRFLPLTSLFLLLFYVFFFSASRVNQVFAQLKLEAGSEVEVKGEVGEYYLDVSGFISPFASVVLTSENKFLRSTVADRTGNFSISSVLIKKGFSSFCLTGVDFERIGESYKCFSFPPAQGSIIMNEIFLPPTLGILRAELNPGAIANSFGYTMPESVVTLHLNAVSGLGSKVLGVNTFDVKKLPSSSSTKLTVMADKKGYYEFSIKNLNAGDYRLYSKAQYKNKTSLTPDKLLQLKMLSLKDQFSTSLNDLWEKTLVFLAGLSLGSLWLAIPIIILIIILTLKLWPERFSFVYENKLVNSFHKRRKKKMHHGWWMGY